MSKEVSDTQLELLGLSIEGAMGSHACMAAKLLNDESTRDVFLTMVYQLLKRNAGADLVRRGTVKSKK